MRKGKERRAEKNEEGEEGWRRERQTPNQIAERAGGTVITTGPAVAFTT